MTTDDTTADTQLDEQKIFPEPLDDYYDEDEGNTCDASLAHETRSSASAARTSTSTDAPTSTSRPVPEAYRAHSSETPAIVAVAEEGSMTDKGQAVLDGDEIVIRVPIAAVMARISGRSRLQVNDAAAFAAEIVEDLNDNPLALIADEALAMVEAYGSCAATICLSAKRSRSVGASTAEVETPSGNAPATGFR
ncbi:MAG TPA: hypothetical protein VLJ39_16795 [Tepidisphaeraceae bacterium]|nr:hypothetical protein [Tepidisphaeraceae bacterium]